MTPSPSFVQGVTLSAGVRATLPCLAAGTLLTIASPSYGVAVCDLRVDMAMVQPQPQQPGAQAPGPRDADANGNHTIAAPESSPNPRDVSSAADAAAQPDEPADDDDFSPQDGLLDGVSKPGVEPDTYGPSASMTQLDTDSATRESKDMGSSIETSPTEDNIANDAASSAADLVPSENNGGVSAVFVSMVLTGTGMSATIRTVNFHTSAKHTMHLSWHILCIVSRHGVGFWRNPVTGPPWLLQIKCCCSSRYNLVT